MTDKPPIYRVVLVRDCDARNPNFDSVIAADCKANGVPYTVPEFVRLTRGTTYSHPDAWKLARHGMGIPADEPTKEKLRSVGISDDQISRAILAAGDLAKGIGYDIPGMTHEEIEE